MRDSMAIGIAMLAMLIAAVALKMAYQNEGVVEDIMRGNIPIQISIEVDSLGQLKEGVYAK